MKKPRLIIISLTTPPEVCGVSDYAFNSAKALLEHYDSIVIGVDRLPVEIDENDDLLSIKHWRDTLVASNAPCDVLLNYTPRGYNKYALPLKLIYTLNKFKLSNVNNRIFVFFHETWNGGSHLKFHHVLMDKFAKWVSLNLSKISSGVAVITEEQEQKLRKLIGNNQNISLLNVGANILPADKDAGLESIRKDGVWVVFGLPHTRLRTLKIHENLIRLFISKGILKTIKALGPSTGDVAENELLFANNAFGNNILKQFGSLSSDDISKELLNSYGAFVGQSADSLRKSGSFAAIAAHGTPVVCSAGSLLLDPPGNGFFDIVELEDNPDIFEKDRIKRSRILHEWYWNSRSWNAIALDLVNFMKN